MGRLIQGTAQSKEWCSSQKWFFLDRVEVRRTLLGNHHLPLPVSSQPCEEAGTSGLLIWQTCWVWVERSSARTRFRNVSPHQSFTIPPFMGLWIEQGIVFWVTSCWSALRCALDGTEVSQHAHRLQTPPGHISSSFTINIHSRASELLWECPFLSVDGRSGQR